MNPRSIDNEADALTTTPSRQFQTFFAPEIGTHFDQLCVTQISLTCLLTLSRSLSLSLSFSLFMHTYKINLFEKHIPDHLAFFHN